mgnify:CR=1 FL=1
MINSSQVAPIMTSIEIVRTAEARRTVKVPILRPKTCGLFRPRAYAHSARINTVNVPVVIPPPMDAGAVPINISMILSNWLAGVRFSKASMALKPAVRAEMDS